ncbi:MAG: hypothetical protein KGL39_47195 [Patescibacteria group bacterium]|nr:hypothetical protein [Patescibacteria group bacterium]
MAYESPIIRSAINNVVQISPPVTPSSPTTYLSEPYTAAGLTLTLLDNTGFSQNDLIIIGKIGSDETESVKINAAVTAGTSLTITAGTFDHSVDAKVQTIEFDQVEISGAATSTGSKSVIATMNLQLDRENTVYVVTGTTYAYYFARYKNSVTSVFSSYSAAATAAGTPTTSVRSVKDKALDMTGLMINDIITDDFLNSEITNCEQEVWSEKRHWQFLFSYDAILGSTQQYSYSFPLPADIADPNTAGSILRDSVRVGYQLPLKFITQSEWQLNYEDVRHTTLKSALGALDTTMALNSSVDFDDTGSVIIYGTSYSYTANDRSTGILTLSAAAGTAQLVDSDVWQNASVGQPSQFMVSQGRIYFDIPVANDANVVNKNVYISYYRKPTAITSDSDTLNLPDFTIYHYYLAYKMLLRNNNGAMSAEAESMFQMYDTRKEILKRWDRTTQAVFLTPRIPTFERTIADPNYTRVTFNAN